MRQKLITLLVIDFYFEHNYTSNSVGKYRYIDDNLPPEAMRAFYFRTDDTLKYSQVNYMSRHNTYILHPITADRFCIAISILEILAPDLFQGFEELSPKGFNPYAPQSLGFWQKNATYLANTKKELLLQAEKTDNLKKSQLLKLIAKYINLDPDARVQG